MAKLEFVKFEKVSLKDHSELNEKWVQERIAENPGLLGLGDVALKDKERVQPRAGRLDLLLQDSDSNQRYEVEVQLGRTDESHIIRTIEYWDIERKRYPQYDHIAVIVAEDITSRFLNVISLFNGTIPLIAIQLNAMKYENQISLLCTTILDQTSLGLVDDDEEQEVTDRSYWEKKATKSTVAMADSMLELIKTFAPEFELTYKKFYIGLACDGSTNNFAVYRPKKKYVRLDLKLKKSEEISNKIKEKDFDLIDYTKGGRYRIRLSKDDITQNEEFIKELLQMSYNENGR
ncbi:MAG: hypothetical protein KAR47_04605 [Planctomycetes bacterium]|nr:hypothetical protein [Planctomycetota bacterium]